MSQQSQGFLQVLVLTPECDCCHLLIRSNTHFRSQPLHRSAEILDFQGVGSQFGHIFSGCFETLVLQGALVEIDDERESSVQRVGTRIEGVAALHLHLLGVAIEIEQTRSRILNGNLLQTLGECRLVTRMLRLDGRVLGLGNLLDGHATVLLVETVEIVGEILASHSGDILAGDIADA